MAHLTIATDVQTASTDRRTPFRGGLPPWLGPAGSGVLFALLFWPTLIGRERKNLSLRVIRAIFLSAVAMQATYGCGGSGSSGSGAPSKTPAGQYSVNVTAISGILSHSTAFQLTVQ